MGKKEPTLWLREKFPYTYDLRWSLLYGSPFVALSAALFIVRGDRWYCWAVLALAGFFYIGPCVIFIGELLADVVPTFKFIPQGLSLIFRIFGKAYIGLLAVFLRPVVEYIIESKSAKDSNIVLRKMPGQDDSYLEEIIDFEDIKYLKIKISSSSNYWRFGLKFSLDPNFDPSRLTSNHPLYHLAKDETNNIVYRVYYDQNANQPLSNQNLVENYDGSPLIFEIDKKDGLRIVIKNAQGEELLSEKFELHLHKYAMIFAWGDGREYSVRTNLEKKEKQI